MGFTWAHLWSVHILPTMVECKCLEQIKHNIDVFSGKKRINSIHCRAKFHSNWTRLVIYYQGILRYFPTERDSLLYDTQRKEKISFLPSPQHLVLYSIPFPALSFSPFSLGHLHYQPFFLFLSKSCIKLLAFSRPPLLSKKKKKGKEKKRKGALSLLLFSSNNLPHCLFQLKLLVSFSSFISIVL